MLLIPLGIAAFVVMVLVYYISISTVGTSAIPQIALWSSARWASLLLVIDNSSAPFAISH